MENSIREFTKVLVIKDGLFGISGWTNLKNAKESKVVVTYVNSFGLESAEVKIVKGGDKEDSSNAPGDDTKSETPNKSSLAKLSAEEVKAKADELGLVSTGTKAETLELLYTHYGL